MSLAAALLLSACGGDANPDSIAAAKPTSATTEVPSEAQAQPTVMSPEELAKHSAASQGYSMKVSGLQDPGKATKEYSSTANTRFVAVQVEFANVSSDDKMTVDIANASITDDKGVDYPSIPGSHDGEVKAADLAKGDKSSGWIGFAVPQDTKLKSVTYRVGLISQIALTADLPAK